jgi:hypothetical protein
MERMNKKAIAAGLKGIHCNMLAWGQPILPVEKVPESTANDQREIADRSTWATNHEHQLLERMDGRK